MNSSKISLDDWLTSNKIPFRKDYEIKYSSWIKAGGTIKNFITPEDISSCKKIIEYFCKNNFEYYILGNQSNVIIRDGYINTPIISTNKLNKLNITEVDKGINIYCESGVPIPRFSKNIIKKGYTGAEGLLGIPGSIGGGICMNASSYGSEVTSYLSNVCVIDEKGLEINLNKDELKLGWRNSLIKNKKYLVIYANFFIPKDKYIGENLTSQNSIKIINHRKNFQENDLPNLGSIFATKDIYKDLSKKNFLFFLLYVFYKISSVYYFNFNQKKLSIFRKNFIKIYLKFLNLDKFEKFSSSSRTLNCLVNRGSNSSTEAINFLKKFKIKTKNCLNLENIILDEIN